MREEQHSRVRSILLVCALAPLGVLLRWFLTEVFYPGGARSTVPGSYAANLLGSGLLGVVHTHASVFPSALLTGLSSGFCACLTTFGVAVFHSGAHFVRGQAGLGITSLLITALSSPAAYVIGRDVASFVSVRGTASDSGKQWLRTGICGVVCAAVFLALAVCAVFNRSTKWVGALLSPLGALVRHELSIRLNKHTWPLGTLIANLCAAGLDSALASIRYRGKGSAFWIDSARLGIVGSLGTISALASELVSLGRTRVLYSTASFIVGVLIVVAIYGAVVWTS